jgi:hypothetical protein
MPSSNDWLLRAAGSQSAVSHEYFSRLRDAKQIFVDQLDKFAAGQTPILGTRIDAHSSWSHHRGEVATLKYHDGSVVVANADESLHHFVAAVWAGYGM